MRGLVSGVKYLPRPLLPASPPITQDYQAPCRTVATSQQTKRQTSKLCKTSSRSASCHVDPAIFTFLCPTPAFLPCPSPCVPAQPASSAPATNRNLLQPCSVPPTTTPRHCMHTPAPTASNLPQNQPCTCHPWMPAPCLPLDCCCDPVPYVVVPRP